MNIVSCLSHEHKDNKGFQKWPEGREWGEYQSKERYGSFWEPDSNQARRISEAWGKKKLINLNMQLLLWKREPLELVLEPLLFIEYIPSLNTTIVIGQILFYGSWTWAKKAWMPHDGKEYYLI